MQEIFSAHIVSSVFSAQAAHDTEKLIVFSGDFVRGHQLGQKGNGVRVVLELLFSTSTTCLSDLTHLIVQLPLFRLLCVSGVIMIE
jgi:hypothetical protein